MQSRVIKVTAKDFNACINKAELSIKLQMDTLTKEEADHKVRLFQNATFDLLRPFFDAKDIKIH